MDENTKVAITAYTNYKSIRLELSLVKHLTFQELGVEQVISIIVNNQFTAFIYFSQFIYILCKRHILCPLKNIYFTS